MGGWPKGLEGFLLHLQGNRDINLGGLDISMAKLILNISDGVAGLNVMAGASVAKSVRGDIDLAKRRAFQLCKLMVFFDNVSNPKSRNGQAPGVENKVGLVVVLVAVLEIALDGLDGFRPKKNITLFVSFTGERGEIGCFQAKIVNLETNDFGDPSTGVVEQKKQGGISKSPKVVGFNSSEDGLDLFSAKGGQDSMGDLFGFDGADPLANRQHGELLACDIAEESVKGSQTSVACLR